MRYFPKIKFLMLMRNERLAALRTRYDDHSHVLAIHADGTEAMRGDLATAQGRTAIERLVHPETAARDLNIRQTLMRSNGHTDCGVDAEVVTDGSIAIGDAIRTEGPGPS